MRKGLLLTATSLFVSVTVQAQYSSSSIVAAADRGRALFAHDTTGSFIPERVLLSTGDLRIDIAVRKSIPLETEQTAKLDGYTVRSLMRAGETSALIARVDVLRDLGHLNESKTYIFTTSEIRVLEILSSKDSKDVPVIGSDVYAMWPGGVVQVHGRRVLQTISDSSPLRVGHTYIVVLKRERADAQDYRLLGQESFDITGPTAVPLEPLNTHVPASLLVKKDDFLKSYRLSVVRVRR